MFYHYSDGLFQIQLSDLRRILRQKIYVTGSERFAAFTPYPGQ
jgi:hypothetical protein